MYDDVSQVIVRSLSDYGTPISSVIEKGFKKIFYSILHKN
jgi:hypothetical protein